MGKRLTAEDWRQREITRERLRKRAIGMRLEGVRIVDVCKELRIGDKQLKQWEMEHKNRVLTPPPAYRGYLWVNE